MHANARSTQNANSSPPIFTTPEDGAGIVVTSSPRNGKTDRCRAANGWCGLHFSCLEPAMLNTRTRREFLSNVGTGMLIATVGPALAFDLGLARADEGGGDAPLSFGELEGLVSLLQETPIAKLNAVLVEKMRSGTDLRTLTAAGALANARTFGGEDYVGFHTVMALGPAYRMSRELPEALAPLPVMKVLYRNTNRIQEHGGRASEVLHAVAPGDLPQASINADGLHDAVRAKDVAKAERI